MNNNNKGSTRNLVNINLSRRGAMGGVQITQQQSKRRGGQSQDNKVIVPCADKKCGPP